MNELRDLAKKLLTDGTVKVVLGYEQGPRGVRPLFATRVEDTERLIFDPRCVQNLVTFLNPRRAHLKRLGKMAVVVKACDARAAAGLLRESQLKRDDVVLIGVRCGGVVGDPAGDATLTADTVAPRCGTCPSRVPTLADHVVGPELPAPPVNASEDEWMARLDAMSHADRWAFWMGELERCVRCNACREVCPLCFCERCVQDKSQPQWIESSPHVRGNLSWHLTRALHLAGRCSGCSECARACPAGIPLNLLNRQAARTVATRFGAVVGDDPNVPAPVGTFRQDDAEEFIR